MGISLLDSESSCYMFCNQGYNTLTPNTCSLARSLSFTSDPHPYIQRASHPSFVTNNPPVPFTFPLFPADIFSIMPKPETLPRCGLPPCGQCMSAVWHVLNALCIHTRAPGYLGWHRAMLKGGNDSFFTVRRMSVSYLLN